MNLVNSVNIQLMGLSGLSRFERLSAALVGVAMIWYAFSAPDILVAFTVITVTAYFGKFLLELIPCFRSQIRFQHILIFIVTTTLIFIKARVAHAIFLSDLEAFIIDLFTASNEQAGGGDNFSVNPALISLMFNVLRGIFLLAVAAATLFAISQGLRGGDWLPIVQQVVMAFAAVMALDIITLVIVGDQDATSIVNQGDNNAGAGGTP